MRNSIIYAFRILNAFVVNRFHNESLSFSTEKIYIDWQQSFIAYKNLLRFQGEGLLLVMRDKTTKELSKNHIGQPPCQLHLKILKMIETN